MINESMLRAAQGLRALQTKVDTIANNIANLNTAGYKSQDTVFGEILYQQINNQPGGETIGANGRITEEMVRMGNGVIVRGTPVQFTQGSRQDTDIPTDLMIEGEGFFRVAQDLNQSGDIDENDYRYTRNGAFKLSPIDDQLYLVTSNGEFVLNEDGDPISFAMDSTFKVLSNGTLVEIDAEGNEYEIGRLGLYRFDHPQLLIRDGNGNWLADAVANPANPIPAEQTVIVQGALESSNVDLSKEMTDLLAAQRTMQMLSRSLQISDQMLGLANELIRR
jgi:flagellar basal-body rod protein FlgG